MSQKFVVYEDGDGDWRWRMVAANGRIVADSGEGYESKRDVREAINRIKEGVHDAAIQEE